MPYIGDISVEYIRNDNQPFNIRNIGMDAFLELSEIAEEHINNVLAIYPDIDLSDVQYEAGTPDQFVDIKYTGIVDETHPLPEIEIPTIVRQVNGIMYQIRFSNLTFGSYYNNNNNNNNNYNNNNQNGGKHRHTNRRHTNRRRTNRRHTNRRHTNRRHTNRRASRKS